MDILHTDTNNKIQVETTRIFQ